MKCPCCKEEGFFETLETEVYSEEDVQVLFGCPECGTEFRAYYTLDRIEEE